MTTSPRRVRALVAMLMLLALAAHAAPALAAPARLRLVPTPVTATTMVDDGISIIGLVHPPSESTVGGVTLVDVGGRLATRTSPAPRALCVPQGVVGGELLWGCARPQSASTTAFRAPEAIVEDVATGARTSVPSTEGLLALSDDEARYTALGTRWAEVTISAYHAARTAYLDRTTGAFATLPEPEPGADAEVDLDDPALVRPLCDGVRRLLGPDGLAPLVHRGAWYAAAGIDADTTAPPHRLVFMRCGRPRIVLRRETADLSLDGPALGTGFVAWVEARRSGTGRSSEATLVVRDLRGSRVGPARRLALRSGGVPLALGSRLYLRQGPRLLRVALGRR